jgi:hypothetical protein
MEKSRARIHFKEVRYLEDPEKENDTDPCGSGSAMLAISKYTILWRTVRDMLGSG